MGGCQNYDPFWMPVIIWHLMFRVPKRGITIWTTTHMTQNTYFSESSTLWLENLGFDASDPMGYEAYGRSLDGEDEVSDSITVQYIYG